MITITEIAKRAGVSRGTVDRVLHNRGRVAAKTRDRVQKIIKDLGYEPNVFARSLSLAKTYRFHVILPEISPKIRYWNIPLQGAQRAQHQLKPHNVEITYFHYQGYSFDSFDQQIRKSLVENPDGLLIAPIIYDPLAKQALDKIPAHIPTVFINVRTPKCNHLAYIGQDFFKSAQTAARLMQLLLPNGGTLAVLTVTDPVSLFNQRVNGFQSFFNEQIKWHVRTVCADIDPENRTDLMIRPALHRLYEQEPVQGIFVTNAHAWQVAKLIREYGVPKPAIIGYDLTERNIPYLADGTIDFIISQRPEIQGYEGIFTLYRHMILAQPVRKTLLLPIDIITKENMDDFVTSFQL
ncbi:substrate-binding domain-containing protein [candidate division KSB1 bacterium]|nr:substrate-binding domain-containing protein [candidate division KSB1 bacterium]